MNPDAVWRWILRMSGLVGIFVGANAEPPWPAVAFVVFAGMIGLDQFIELRNGKK